jgi:hypothetical protein
MLRLPSKERALISQRTRDALNPAKACGVVLGNPKLGHVRDRAVSSLKADADLRQKRRVDHS